MRRADSGSCIGRFDWRDWRDRLNGADPGLNQLRKAARATLSSIIATFVLFRLIEWLHEPKAVAFIGILISILGVMLVNDPTPGEQRTTTLLVPIPAMISVTLGTFVAPLPLLNNFVFVAIIFVAVFTQQFGARYIALGFVLFIAYFDALFFHARVIDVPWLLLGVVFGAALAYVMRFLIWPDRPERILRLTALAYRGQLRNICRELARRALADKWGRREDNRLMKMTGKLNDVALAFEHAVASVADPSGKSEPPPEFRQWILETELDMESMAESVAELVRAGPVPEGLKQDLHDTLCRVREALRESDARLPASALRDALVAVERSEPAPDAMALQHFNEALQGFADVLEDQVRPELRRELLRPSSSASGSESCEQKGSRKLEWRHTVQATLAGVGATVAGQLISAQRWYWAVLAAFVVFIRANTSSETLVRGWQRVLGTIVGVAVGMGIGEAVMGHHWLQIVLIYVCIFFAYLFIRVSYAWTMIWFTLLLSILYSLLGLLTPGLLALRLVLTIVGAAVGVLCARFVLPMHTGRKVRDAAIAVLQASGDFLANIVADKPTDAAMTQQARDLDQRLQELREAALPLERRFLPVEGREQTQLVEAVTAVAFFTRQLARASRQETFTAMDLTEPARRLSENVAALIGALSKNEMVPVRSISSALDARRARLQTAGNDASRFIDWLRRIDQELVRIAGFKPIPGCG